MTDPSAAGIVIVGGGQAGGELAVELRRQAYAGRVTILTEEAQPPYRRPPLSKAYLAGTATVDSLHVAARAQLDKQGIEVRTGARVEAIDRVARQLRLADGGVLPYESLALTTGARARRLALPGAEAANVIPLRTVADVDAIRARCAPGKRLAIVGGGFIGLEVAAVAVKMGLQVTLLESLPRVLARVTSPVVSEFYERVHREAGVDLRTSVQISAFDGAPEVREVVLGDGSRIGVDLVVYGIGVVPNVELAAAAGLEVDNGIVVDERAATADPHIVAAGDCTSHPSEFLGRRLRLESVQNALEQARVAASTLLGKPAAYRNVPWFWSDQYDLKLQMVGISTGYDELVVRGDPATRSFAVFYLGDGKVIAADAVNRAQDFLIAKKIVAARAALAAPLLRDESVALKTLAG